MITLSNRYWPFLTALAVLCAHLPATSKADPFHDRVPPIENSIGMKLRLIPPGTSLMGAADNEAGRESQETRHEVQLTKGFYLGEHEVTVGPFKAFIDATKFQTDAEKDGKGAYGIDPDDKIKAMKPPLTWKNSSTGCLVPALAHAQDVALRDLINREIRASWVKEKITPPEQAADSTFLRRIYLDLAGMIPTYEETIEFLNDTDPNKREKLIDKLLADPRFARQQAHAWDLAMLGRKNKLVEGTTGYRNRERFRQWLRKQFEANEPCDRIAAKILEAQEDDSQLFLAANNNTDEMVTSVSRFFLATQIQCAKCHDHPFEPWTQMDYHGMAGFFVRTMVVEVPGKPEITNKMGKQFLVGERPLGEVMFTIPAPKEKPGETPAKKVKKDGVPISPKFLNGVSLTEPERPKDYVEPKLKANELPPRPAFSRREKFIGWMTAQENPYFAKAAVNRIWAQFMGRGFVHPVDDFNQQNDPSHPALLKAMESEFIAHRFDLKWLVREIVNSEAYQAADIGPVTDAMPKFYERARIRPLSVEELTASLHIATGLGVESALKSEPNAQMLQYLGEPADGQGRFQGSLSEHLFLHNGDQFRGMCRPNKSNLPEKLMTGDEPWNAKVERLFLSVLSRPAASEERERFVKYLNVETKDAKTASQRMEDAMWVLVSCSEFRFNR